jgi:hypothetical protein
MKYQRFNFGGIPHIPAFWCTAKTSVAEEFVKKHGEVFVVRSAGKRNGNPVIMYETGHNTTVELEKRPDGIYVDGVFFAKDWNDHGKESTSS